MKAAAMSFQEYLTGELFKIRKGTPVHMTLETTVGITGIVVTIISIIVTTTSMIQSCRKHRHQKSKSV